jgi:hypothetical protein
MILSLKRNLNAAKRSSAFKDMPYSKRRLTMALLLILSMSMLTSCGIYNGGFERGGDLTSNFLERIQENSKDQEDELMPEKGAK